LRKDGTLGLEETPGSHTLLRAGLASKPDQVADGFARLTSEICRDGDSPVSLWAVSLPALTHFYQEEFCCPFWSK